MASKSITVERVFRVNGRVYINWANNDQTELGSLAEAKEWAKSLTDDLEFIKKLALARYFFVDPDGSNPDLIVGRTVTITNESNNMVSVQ